jgi:hypothetical protein
MQSFAVSPTLCGVIDADETSTSVVFFGANESEIGTFNYDEQGSYYSSAYTHKVGSYGLTLLEAIATAAYEQQLYSILDVIAA